MAAHQAKIALILGTDPRRLLEHAAAEFLTPVNATPQNPFPSPAVVLALRQGGLRDDLFARAHERGVGGWYDPPLCTFQELPKWLGRTDRRPLTELDRRVMLGKLIREQGGAIFGRLRRPEHFLVALDRLMGELVGEGVPADAFAAALSGRAGRDQFETKRDAELAAIYRGYLAALAESGRRDGRDGWADCALAVAAKPDALASTLGGRRELRLFGLQDLKNGWRPLLRALRRSPALDRICIYSAAALPLDAELEAMVTRLDEPATIATRLFGPPIATDIATVQIIAAPDAEREMEEVAARIRALADAGVPFHRMAVVARQARPYADMAASALERFGVPATTRRRHVLRDIPVIRALASLLTAAAEGWSRHGLVELAEQPYFANDIRARLVNQIGFERRVQGLADWAAAIRQAEGGEPSAAFERFAAHARELDDRRTLAGWIAWLHRFLTDDPWQMRERINAVPGERFDVVRLDLAGWKQLTQVTEQWMAAVAGWGAADAPLDAAGFRAQLDDLLDQEVPLWTPVRRGVPVLEGFAAAYRSFDHLFLVGLEVGRFPVRSPGSPLLDETERAAVAEAGVPLELRAEWDRREMQLFRTLVAGARQSLTVSYSRLDPAGREVVRSSFVEALGEVATLVGAAEGQELPPSRVLTPGMRICSTPDAAAHAKRVARIELDRAGGRLSPWNGRIENPELLRGLALEFGDDRIWSPTQLESFAKCPWAYFSGRLLQLDLKEDPDDEMDSMIVGTVLHDALRRFYDGEVARNGGPVLLLAADQAAAIPRLHAALDEALTATGETTWLGHPSLAGAKRVDLTRMLTRYLAFEIEYNEKLFNNQTNNAYVLRTAVESHELSFRDIVLERGGVRFRFRGSIDRVEVGVDDRVDSARYVAAVDYKTSKYTVPGSGRKEAWEDGVVLQVPLYAYALSQLRPGTEISRVEYRAVKQRSVLHSLQLVEVDRKKEELLSGDEDIAKMDAALDAVATHVLRARAGEFPAEPAPSCGCPPFCHAWDICRVAGGPREKEGG